MKSIQPLPGHAVKLVLTKLQGELGPADFKKIVQAVDLIDAQNQIRFDVLLATLYPGVNHDAALSGFRGLRARLGAVSESTQIKLMLVQDGQTRSLPQERWCWFEGENALALAVLAQAQSTYAPDENTFVSQTSNVIAQDGKEKKKLRYFVSYAHDDNVESEKLQKLLGHYFGSSAAYTFERWHDKDIDLGNDWHNEIQAAIDGCDFGLLLLSPAFFSRRYILQNELPKFIGAEKKSIPVALKDILFDGSISTFGVDKQQVFFDSNHRSFQACQSKKMQQDFAQDLWKKIYIALEKSDAQQSKVSNRTNVAKTDSGRDSPLQNAKKLAFDSNNFSDRFNEQDGQFTQLNNVASLGKGSVNQEQLDEPAIKFLEKWAADEQQSPYLALLGETGMGKTTHCKQITRILCDRYAETADVPLPIYLDLRLLAGTAKLASKDAQEWQRLLSDGSAINFLLKESAGQSSGLSLTAQDLKILLTEHRILVIFDGLDEVLVQLESPSLCGDFVSMLYRLLPMSGAGAQARPAGKMIVACRSHYFPSVAEQNATLLQYGKDKMRANLFTGLVLLPFRPEQIKNYLRLSLPNATTERVDQVFDLLSSVHNLMDVSSRPMNLSLLNDYLPVIEDWKLSGKIISSVRIYDYVIQQWLVRDTDKHHVGAHLKPHLMMHLALALWKNGARSWTNSQLEQWLVEFRQDNSHYKAAVADKAIELLKEDLRNSTFIVRLSDDTFRFAHTSMQEYFLARALFDDLQAESTIGGAWDSMVMSTEVFDFLGEMIVESDRSEGVLLAMRNRLEVGGASEQKQLLAYCLAAQRKNFPTPSLNNWICQDLDLSGQLFEGTKERPLSLRGTVWRNAVLQSARFKYCDLSGTVFDGDFRYCKFDDCFLNDAKPNWAKFAGTDFLRCDVRGCNVPPTNSLGIEFMSCLGFNEMLSPSNGLMATVRYNHTAALNTITYSPDGMTLASSGDDGSVKLWDSASHRLIASLEQHKGGVRSVAFSADGKTLTSAGDDGSVKLWDSSSHRLIASLEQHEGLVFSVAFSADGKTLASAGEDGTVKLWDSTSHRLIASLEHHKGVVFSVAFSADGKTLASAGEDGTVKLWDSTSHRLIASLKHHKVEVFSVAFSADGKTLASAGRDGSVKLWDSSSHRLIASLGRHEGLVFSVAFSADGKTLASAGEDGSVNLWDSTSHRLIASLEQHIGSVRCVAFSADGRTLASAGGDGSVKLRDRVSQRLIALLEQDNCWLLTVAFSADGKTFANAGGDGSVRLWDRASHRLIASSERHNGLVSSVAFSADGKTLASAGSDGSVKLWDSTSQGLIASLEQHKGMVFSIAFSADGKTLASAGGDGSVKLWDNASHRLIASLEQHKGLVFSAAFSADGKTLASGSGDGSVKLWDSASHRLIASLEQHKGWVRSVAFSADGKTLASAGDDGSVKLWDNTSHRLIASLEQHGGPVFSVAFSPDGKTLASAGGDRSVKLWDSASYRLIASLEQHKGLVFSVAFSTDGKLLISSGTDCFRYWNLTGSQTTNTHSTVLIGPTDYCTIDHTNNQFIDVVGEAERFARWFNPGPPAQWFPTR
jgi:WD40 repeat protein/uncharacterized protein YjbI with pentapeptide repeats